MGAPLKQCDVRLMCRWSGMSFLFGVVDCRPSYHIGSGIMLGHWSTRVALFATDACCCTCSLSRPDSMSHLYRRLITIWSSREGTAILP